MNPRLPLSSQLADRSEALQTSENARTALEQELTETRGELSRAREVWAREKAAWVGEREALQERAERFGLEVEKGKKQVEELSVNLAFASESTRSLERQVMTHALRTIHLFGLLGTTTHPIYTLNLYKFPVLLHAKNG